MSDFKALKNARKHRSFIPPSTHARTADVPSEAMAPTAETAVVSGDMDVDGTSTSTTASVEASPTLVAPTDNLYKAIPPTLEIKTMTDAGRGLFSAALYKPGDILFSVKPHVAALSVSNLDGYCSSCFGVGELKRCTGCKTVMYCSSTCQSKDWSFHKNECTALQKWMKAASEAESSSQDPRPPSDALRCLGRVLWKRAKLGSSHPWVKEYDNLQSHRSSLSKESGSFTSEVHAHLAHGVVGYLGLTSPEQLEPYDIHSAADLVDLVSRFTTNTFTVTTPSLSPLGACVAPSVALINHSCNPNAVVVFPRPRSKDDEPLMQVIALKYIQPGEEVLTSYIDTALPRELRQKALNETYHFTCRCAACAPKPGAPVDMREAMWCPKRCGGVCCLPTERTFTRCTKCGAVVKDTDAVLDALRIGQEALEKAERVQNTDPAKSLQLTEKLGEILVSAGLVPGAHPLLALTRLRTSLFISRISALPDSDVEVILSPGVQREVGPAPSTKEAQGEAQRALDEAIRSASRANTGLGQVLVYGHPVRGVSLAELGKLLAVDEPVLKGISHPNSPPQNLNTSSPMYPPSGPQRLELAQSMLVQAHAELLVGFGGGKNEGGEVGREVRRQIVDVEKELGVWKEGVRNVVRDVREEKRARLK